MLFRLATPADSAALLSVYAPYIDTPVTFECQLPSVPEFTRRVTEILSFYPYLAVEQDGRIVGYAYAHRHHERAAYQWDAELSIYLDPAHTGRGVGRALYSALMQLLQAQGLKNVYGKITVPNAQSEALHRSLGFACLGVYRQTGYKNGHWHDVALYEKRIAPCTPAPAPPVALARVPAAKVQAILQAARQAPARA